MLCNKCNFNNPSGTTTCRVCGAQLSVSDTPSRDATVSSTASTPAVRSASGATARTGCAMHPGLTTVPCASCNTALCAQCMKGGVLNKLRPCGMTLCAECHDEAIMRPGFCPKCEAEVQFVDSVDNYVKGDFFSNFFGEAEQCPKCNSVVRTLWFGSIFPLGILLLPVLAALKDVEALRPYVPQLFRISVIPFVPLASYRDRIGLVTDERGEDVTLFQRGRTHLRWNQVGRTAAFWFVPIGIIILALVVLSFAAQPT